jgi:hypothetical protein
MYQGKAMEHLQHRYEIESGAHKYLVLWYEHSAQLAVLAANGPP